MKLHVELIAGVKYGKTNVVLTGEELRRFSALLTARGIPNEFAQTVRRTTLRVSITADDHTQLAEDVLTLLQHRAENLPT